MQSTPLTPPPRNLVLASSSKSWSTITRMLGLVVLVAFMSQLAAIIAIAPLFNEPGMAFGGAICMIPFVLIFFFVRRDKLLDVHLITPDSNGRTDHMLPGNRVLRSPQPAIASRHLIRDSPPLEIPKPSILWMLFFGGVIISIAGFIPVLIYPDNSMAWILAILIAIPALVVGFATPAFAWWSFSTTHLRLKTSRHAGEGMLIAGMLSTIPAIIINSALFPVLISTIGISDEQIAELLILTISAPVGEEICKALAVFSLAGLIDSKKRGFQVGFTVGLGFALLENLQYILFSLFAGEFVAFSYGLTTVVRGIGSIPGHALWTACSGYAIGHILEQRNQPRQIPDVKQWDLIDPFSGQTSNSYMNPEQYMRNSLFSKSSNLQLPNSLPVMLGIAMFGHAFWNGSSVLMSHISGNLNPVAGLIAELMWIVILITLLWIIGRFVIAAAMEE